MSAHATSSAPRRLPRTAQPSFTDAVRLSPWLVLVALVLFVPDELSVYFGDFRMSLSRILFFPMTPILSLVLVASSGGGKRHLIATDLFVGATGVWIIAAATVVSDFGSALHHNAPEAAEYSGAYLATRVLLARPGQALKFVNLLCHVIAIVALFAIPDSLKGGRFIHKLLGHPYAPSVVLESRLGITRAEGLLDHPILLGTVCAVGLLLAVKSPIRARLPTIAACALGVFLSASGGPWLGAGVGLALLAYDRMLARIRYRWQLLMALLVLAYAAASTVSSQPFAFIVTHTLITGDSYWTRVAQWRMIGPMVLDQPWFGIGAYSRRTGEILWRVDLHFRGLHVARARSRVRDSRFRSPVSVDGQRPFLSDPRSRREPDGARIPTRHDPEHRDGRLGYGGVVRLLLGRHLDDGRSDARRQSAPSRPRPHRQSGYRLVGLGSTRQSTRKAPCRRLANLRSAGSVDGQRRGPTNSRRLCVRFVQALRSSPRNHWGGKGMSGKSELFLASRG